MVELEIKPSAASRIRVVVVLALAAAIIAVFVFLLTGGGKNLFETKTTFVTYMPDVTGLYVTADVRLSGIPIGEVTKIELSGQLDPQRVVRVEARISDRFLKNIPQDSQTSVTADTLVGWDFVSIDEGQSPIPLARNGVLRSEPVKQASDRADLMRAAQTELRQVDELLTQVSSGETPIGQFIMGDQVYVDLLKRIDGFDAAVHSFVAPNTDIGQGLFSNALYGRLHRPLLDFDAMLAAIQRGEGAAGKLFASDEQYTGFVRSLQGLRAALADVNQGKGQLGSLLQDPAAYNRVRQMLEQTDNLLRSLNAGEGPVGHYLSNPEVYESLNGSLRSLQELLADFRQNPQKYLRYKVF